MDNNEEHLPLYGVGPIIVYGQVVITVLAIMLAKIFDIKYGIEILRLPFVVLGILYILFGLFLDLSAKLKSKLFKNVAENKLITSGVYSITRNPVYTGAFLICLGIIFITNNLFLFVVPVICWIYMTIF